jgi:hypothetical protein
MGRRARFALTVLALCAGAVSASAQPTSTPGEPSPEPYLPQTDLGAAGDLGAPETPRDADGWWIDHHGFVRVALEIVANDPNFDFVGANNGFVLHNARLGLAGGHRRSNFSWVISVDGAADIRENLNIPAGSLDVRLRDAYLREDLWPWFGFQLGQFKAPFSAEELRSTSDLRFASRAVGLEGVRVGRGFEQPGIVVDRQLGFMLSPREPFLLPGGFGFWYGLMLANGNGDNAILNDNNMFAYYGRLELFWGDLVRVGGSVLWNARTEGELPDRFEEDDFGWSVDLVVSLAGLEVFGQLTSLRTEFPTTGSPTREQLAWHAQAVYLFDLEPLPPFGPAYRIAFFDPRAEGGEVGGVSLEQFRLLYHTIGLNIGSRRWPVTTLINYTFTTEEAPRELENNRFELLVQIEW